MQLTRARSLVAIALLWALALALAGVQAPVARAVEIPPPNSPIFIQTNGPTAALTLGDWYTNAANGVGAGYHYFSITVPCGWPAARAFQMDLFSPEINTFLPLPRLDETSGATDQTVFELYGPFTVDTVPDQPGPGTAGSLLQRTFDPVAAVEQEWVRLYTIPAPVECGVYLLRAETKNNDQNGWRLRVGLDDDDDPTTDPPDNYSDPDEEPGSGDEVEIALAQTTYQHNETAPQCLTLYQFVDVDRTEAVFHNFDLDNNVRVTYYPPSAQYDAQGALTPGAYPGTLSGNAVWNNSPNVARGAGDRIVDPEPGLWAIVTCVRGDNQFNQEGITGEPVYLEPPPLPDMVVSKDDGRTVVAPGDTLVYTITFSNQSDVTRPNPGAAYNVVLTDELPPNTTYIGCGFVTPGLTGSCAEAAGVVTFNVDGLVKAGDSGQVSVTVRVNQGATGQVVNEVELNYQDSRAKKYEPERDDDVDTIPVGLAPDLSATKTARMKVDPNGNGQADPNDVIEYTITVLNSGTGGAFDVTVDDTPDQYTTLIVGSVLTEPDGTVLAGNTPGDVSVSARFDTIPAGAEATVIFDVRVDLGIPDTVTELVNQGTITYPGGSPVCTDDPALPGDCDPTTVPYDPTGTAIELLDLSAERSGSAVELRWVTGAEVETAGFHLYRAGSPDRGAATRVTTALIPARGGPGSGASYAWTDTAPPAGPVYYWLVEVETGGDISEHGPVSPGASTAVATQIYLPQLSR